MINKPTLFVIGRGITESDNPIEEIIDVVEKSKPELLTMSLSH